MEIAVRCGRKTQFRAVMDPQPKYMLDPYSCYCYKGLTWHDDDPTPYDFGISAMCPFGAPGDVLREGRRLSRLLRPHLTIQSVRVEKLDSISEEDAAKEGMFFVDHSCEQGRFYNDPYCKLGFPSAREAFFDAWKRTHGEWLDLWVWRVTFEMGVRPPIKML